MRAILLFLPNYFTRIPDQNFITSSTNESADGSRVGDKLISGMRGEGWAMVHLPHGGSVEVDLQKALPGSETAVGKEYRAWWVDPRTGGKETLGKGKSDGPIKGRKKFTAKDNEDWLLLLEGISGTPAWFARK
jgi:hypothetical protein